MAGLIRRNDIDEVRSRTNIADIISPHVALRNAGPGSMKGLCPFHDEKTPSFHVKVQTGRYHCFGCGEDGDVFAFLQKYEQISFTEAVERLAAKAGITLHYEDGAEAAVQQGGNRTRLLAANKAAARFFSEQLASPEAEPARQFLSERNFDQQAAEHFGLGYAPKGFDQLRKALQSQGFSQEELVTAGLLSQNERGSVYDRFRGRLIWPIKDVTAQVLGFGARKLYDDDQGPKYLNTPETPVYRKSHVLYGLDLARREIAAKRQVVVVEGYTDVMAMHLAGITTAVATCGTAFGVDHIALVRRLMGDDTLGLGEIVFTFDPDAAGQRAALRAFAEEKRFSAHTFVAVPGDGLDPSDLRQHRGDEAVRQLVADKIPMFEFVIRQILNQHNLQTIEGQVSAMRLAAPVIAGMRDPALKPSYTRLLAKMLGMELAEVQAAVRNAPKQNAPQPVARPEYQPPAEEQALPGGEPQLTLSDLPNDHATRLEKDALAAMLQYPEKIPVDLLLEALRSRIANPVLLEIQQGIASQIDHLGASNWVDLVEQEVPQRLERVVRALAAQPLPHLADRDLEPYLAGLAKSLVVRELKQTKAELLAQLSRMQTEQSDREASAMIQHQLQDVELRRRRLEDDEISYD